MKPSDFKVGDLYDFESFKRFDGLEISNTARVTDVLKDKIYMIFIDVENPSNKRLSTDKIFCEWDFELEKFETKRLRKAK